MLIGWYCWLVHAKTKEQSKGTKEISKSSPIPQPKSKAVEVPAHKGKEKAKTKENIPKPSPKQHSKSQAVETISANLSKVAGACQNSSNQGELEWNDKVCLSVYLIISWLDWLVWCMITTNLFIIVCEVLLIPWTWLENKWSPTWHPTAGQQNYGI